MVSSITNTILNGFKYYKHNSKWFQVLQTNSKWFQVLQTQF